MRRAVDRDDADFVVRPERLDRRARALVRQIHLRAAVADRGGHAAGSIERHDHGQRELAMLVLELHRYGQIGIERGFEVAADAERAPAAGEEQSAPEVGREMHQRFERRRPS